MENNNRDTSWDDPQLSDGDCSPIKKQREEIIKKWADAGLLDNLINPNDEINMWEIMDGKPKNFLPAMKIVAELMESEACKLLKKEIASLDDLNDYLKMLADMDNIGIQRKLVLLEGYVNKIKKDIGWNH